jgi:hypothetical membrane protein
MKKYLLSKTLWQWLSLSGFVAIILYFVHVWVGTANYPGYDSLSQAVSDLTAVSSPSHGIAVFFSSLSSVFNVLFAAVMCFFVRGKINRTFRIGVYAFAAMNTVSAVGYAFFPLTSSGFAGTFQDVMHMVVTGFVVLLTIVSFLLVTIGLFRSHVYKAYAITSLIFFILLFIGSAGTGMMPKAYFGISERVSIFTVILYSGFLAVFAFLYQNKDINQVNA